MKEPTHLGDGAYATFDEHQEVVVLTANHHDPRQATDTVVIDYQAWKNLCEYLRDTNWLCFAGRVLENQR